MKEETEEKDSGEEDSCLMKEETEESDSEEEDSDAGKDSCLTRMVPDRHHHCLAD